ncbi:protein kinase (plasmid) [Deinococcus taeanensis]|uniref:FHA domain-containing serine/threonine-protein kinase n=1 Tax=Deinococcus taeanensis TaxID=2737050 RepID=UPI001CDD1038|nr:FHA domain-containing serine/threonine-protein kinase [Deinococcus taeanensis]UBV44953.1 protein kinase [Deinococcus taeanensis]
MTDTRTFHHYQLSRPLGGGWLGTVYTATDLDEGREVALRVLDEASSGQSFLIMQLERLLLRVSTLSHPHLLPTGELQLRAGRAFYSMQLGRAGSARQILQSQSREAQPLPIVTAVELVRQAAAGLAHAHAHGLMHGNLKPENLILQPGRALLGHTGYVTQLADFGLAELRAGSYGTHDRAVVNALAYMSPEQCRGVRNELRTDLYALGLILYELLTGMVPFEIRDAAEALEKHQHVAPRQPSRLRPDLPETLEEVLLTCLAKDPDDRYADAAALEAALQEILNGLMPGGPEPTVRLSALPVLPPAPPLDSVPASTQTQLLVFSERHELLRTLPVSGETLTVGRGHDNTVVLEHSGVSRHHLNVSFTAGQAAVTELTATNGAVMDGLPLTPMTPLRWPDRTPLYLRPYWLVLVGPQRAPAHARIVVTPERPALTLVPGTPTLLHLNLANTGVTVDHFRLTLDGIPPEWVQDAHQEVQLNPGMQGHATLTLLAPRDSRSRAGTYDVTVIARSRENPAETGSAPLALTVAPFQETVATLLPPVRRTWRHTTYTLKLENRGNTDLTVSPRLHDNEGAVHVLPRWQDFVQVPQNGTVTARGINPEVLAREAARQAAQEARHAAVAGARRALMGQGRIRVTDVPARVPLTAGQTREETMKVRVPLRWVGAASQHRLHLNVFPVAADDEVADRPVTSAEAELHHVPLIPLWLLPLLILLIGVLIWWLTRPPQITQFDLSGSDTVVAPGQPFTLRWDTQNVRNVSILELGDQGQRLGADGTLKISGIQKDQKYTLVARSLIGRRVERAQVVQARFERPVIELFDVTPPRVSGNQPVTVTWRVRNAPQVSISELGKVPASGKSTFVPAKDTTLILTAQNGSERETDTRSVSVLGPEVKEFKFTPAQVKKGESSVLSWNVTNATEVTIDGLGTVEPRGQKTLTPRDEASATYVITATGAGGITKSANVRLDLVTPKPQFTQFEISPNPVRSDQKFKIIWKTRDASSVNVQYGQGAEDSAPQGETIKDAPPASTSITLTARNDAGDQVPVSKQLTVIPVDRAAEEAAAAAQAKAAAEKEAQAKEQADVKKITFTATPEQITGQGDVTLNWQAEGFQNVTILPLTGPMPNGRFDPTGTRVIEKVNTTRTYTLVLYLRNGKQLRLPRTVKVTPLPVAINAFTVSSAQLSAPGPVTLSWDVANTPAVRLAGLPGPLPGGKWPPKGNTTLTVNATRTFTLTAGAAEQRQTVQVRLPIPSIQAFTVTPTQITGSGVAVLAWNVQKTPSVRIDGVKGPNRDGSWPAQGRTTVPVNATRTFTLRAGTVTGTQTITVRAAPRAKINSFTASALTLSAPGQVTFTWDVANASAARLSGPAGQIDGSRSGGLWGARDSTRVLVSRSGTYTLSAGGEQRTQTITVKAAAAQTQSVTPTPPPVPNTPPNDVSGKGPIVTRFNASARTIQAGQSVTFNWYAVNTSTVRIDGIDGPLPPNGKITITPTVTHTYTLTADDKPYKTPITVTVTGDHQPDAYTDLAGTWIHPFGTVSIQNVDGRAATGTFTSTRPGVPTVPVALIFNGETLSATSPKVPEFSFVASIRSGRKTMLGTYTLKGEQERWCMYRPGTPRPAECR